MLTTVTVGGKAADGSERTSQTVSCDQCGYSLDPGERAADDAPWNDAEALSAALSRGWLVDIFTAGLDRCRTCAREALS